MFISLKSIKSKVFYLCLRFHANPSKKLISYGVFIQTNKVIPTNSGWKLIDILNDD